MRRVGIWLGLSLVVFVAAPLVSADGAESVAIVGTASASGVRATYSIPDYLLVSTILDGGGPVAQASLNTSGGSTGFASLPYPGDTVVTAPGLLPTVTGHSSPASYPLYAQAVSPGSPTAAERDPSGQYSLDAAASNEYASATAQLGAPTGPSGATSMTRVSVDAGGKVTVVADATARGLDFGGVLKIGIVASHSVTTMSPGEAKPVTTSSTTVTGVTVAGQLVGVGPSGIEPLGVTPAPVIGALAGVLEHAGITVRTVGSEPVAGGTATSALQVRQTGVLPLPGSPRGTIVWDLATASTATDVGSGAAVSAGAPIDGEPPSPAVPISLAVGSPRAPVVPHPGTPAIVMRPAASFIARDLRSTFRLLYIVTILGAVAALVESRIWHCGAVRASWETTDR